MAAISPKVFQGKDIPVIIDGTVKHIPELVTLFHVTQNYHHKLLEDIFVQEVPEGAIKKFFMAFLGKPRNPLNKKTKFAYIAEENGQVQGYILFSLTIENDPMFSNSGWTCNISDIVVAPECRGRGIAESLLEKVREKISTYGPCIVTAQVWHNNIASEKLFKKFGFNQVASNFQMRM